MLQSSSPIYDDWSIQSKRQQILSNLKLVSQNSVFPFKCYCSCISKVLDSGLYNWVVEVKHYSIVKMRVGEMGNGIRRTGRSTAQQVLENSPGLQGMDTTTLPTCHVQPTVSTLACCKNPLIVILSVTKTVKYNTWKLYVIRIFQAIVAVCVHMWNKTL